MATLARFAVPTINNEPNRHYAPGSPERAALRAAIDTLRQRAPLTIPLRISGKDIHTPDTLTQSNPSAHASPLAHVASASRDHIDTAIADALHAQPQWEALPFADRAAVFLKAADLVAGKYRAQLMAATMLGQGKNAWQAEIDAAAELADFLRFNVKYAEQVYAQQPVHHSQGVWNRVEYRPLEGFTYAVSPFNFTAIGGNLPAAPALMGNVVIWKPSPMAVASNDVVHQILLESGLPPSVIQFVPGDAVSITSRALSHPAFAALHYTGSTAVFRSLQATIATTPHQSYPRLVAETGGKNFHLLHASADVANAVAHTVRAAFEYSGQKCSAASRVYVPRSLWPDFKRGLLRHTKNLKVGDPTRDWEVFVGPVISKSAFDRLKGWIDRLGADPGAECLTGGEYDESQGWFVQPSVYEVKDAGHALMKEELFGPVLGVYVYDDGASQPTTPGPSQASTADPGRDPSISPAFAAVCKLISDSTPYGLTGAVFARDRSAIAYAESALRHAAGNFYINCKCTGAVVGQQPFGGARASGTNDKAGSPGHLARFVNARAIKEEFVPLNEGDVPYPSNAPE